MIRLSAQQQALPHDTPFYDPDLAAELFTALRQAVDAADRSGAICFVAYLPERRDFEVRSHPPADPGALHLVCVPHRDPLLLTPRDYQIVAASAERERRAG